MKRLLILAMITFSASACNTFKPSEHDNLAAKFVHAQESKADCVSYYSYAGSDDLDSALCVMPNKVVLYCTMEATVSDKAFHCTNATPPPPPQPQAAQIQTTAPKPPATDAGSGSGSGK